MGRLDEKVAIVTGGASGLGEATALEFVKEGAKVAIADISEKGQDISEDLNSQGYDTIFVTTDVSKEEDIKNLIATTVEKYGKLDVMFANAGINVEGNLHDLDLTSWQNVIDINLTGVYLSDKYAVEQF